MSPKPWKVDLDRDSWSGPLPPMILDTRGNQIATVETNERLYTSDSKDRDPNAEAARDKANAAYIVRAVNCYEELVAACEAVLDGKSWDESGLLDLKVFDQIKQAIALAKGGAV